MTPEDIEHLGKTIQKALRGAWGNFHVKVNFHKGKYLVSVNGLYVYEPDTMQEVFTYLSAFFLKATVVEIEDLASSRQKPKPKKGRKR